MYQISFLLRMNIVLLVVNFHQIDHTKKAHSNKVNQNAHYIEIKIVGSNAGTNRLFLYKSLIE